MNAYKLETTLTQDGKLSLDLESLPFSAGMHIEVLLREIDAPKMPENPYPLHNIPYRYDDPFEPVALEDWEILQ